MKEASTSAKVPGAVMAAMDSFSPSGASGSRRMASTARSRSFSMRASISVTAEGSGAASAMRSTRATRKG